MGDMPNFEDMSEEEQMRWLESLAKRQGANEGFTTSADLEVPEVDPNDVVIDEPGYTPYYSSASSATPEESGEPQEVQETPQELEEPPVTELDTAARAAAAQQDEEDLSTVVGGDPMAWLESLAKRQGAHEGFTTSADLEVPEIDPDSVVIDEPGYTPFYESGPQSAKTSEVDEVPSEAGELEDLAPSATFDVQPPADVPHEAPEPWTMPIAPEDDSVEHLEDFEALTTEPDMDFGEPDDELAAAALESAETIDTGEFPSDVDPMVWLESLAKRQGAHEGFTTTADLEVPEVDPDSVVIDEPGYTPYYSGETTGSVQKPQAVEEQTPLEIPPLEPEAYATAPDPAALEEGMIYEEGAPVGLPDEDPNDGWLYDLAEETGDVEDFLSELSDTGIPALDDDFGYATDIEFEEDVSAPSTSLVDGLDVTAMSDEEIAAAQAAGTITPEQELAWLKSKITEVGDEDEFDFALEADDSPAVAGDIPDWLKDQMPSEDELDTYEVLDEDEAVEYSFDIDDDLVTSLASEDELDIDLTPAFEDDSEPVVVAEEVDLLQGYAPDIDEWAAALDQDVQIDDISSIPEPDWYTQALEMADENITEEYDVAPALSYDAGTGPEDFIAEDEGDVPAWLQGVEPTVEEDTDLPDWLRVVPEDEGAADVASWLSEQQTGLEAETPAPAPAAASVPEPQMAGGLPLEAYLSPAREGALPSWYQPQPAPPVETPPAPAPVAEVREEPRPAPVSPPAAPPAQRTAPPPPVTPAAAPVPVGYEDVKQRLEANPQDHETRLNLARNLNKSGNLDESLGQYETLINNSANLDHVSNDLAIVIKQMPSHPKARRLLGDVYMRQGRLQEALDAYRGALDQI